MSSKILRNLSYSALAAPFAFLAFGVAAQAAEREFTWQGQNLIVPEACLDEERRLILIRPEHTVLCSDLSSETIEGFNTALSDEDPANDPVAVIDDSSDEGVPETTGSVKPNSGAGNDGETGLTETAGGTDEDPGNSGANNNAPSDPPGQVK